MATYTREQLRDGVLSEIRVLDAHEAASAEDSVLALARIDQMMEALADETEALLPFDIEGPIPGPYFIPLIQVIAPTLCQPFGKDPDKFARGAEMGMRALRRLKSKPYYGAAAKATYY